MSTSDHDNAYSLRSRPPGKMTGGSGSGSGSGSGNGNGGNRLPPYPFPFSSSSSSSRSTPRNPPHLPTPTEQLALLLYPALLAFGTVFSLVSPETRAAPYDAARQAHAQDPALAPSYFARKDNLLNVLFVKRGWAWVTAAFVAFVVTHPIFSSSSTTTTTTTTSSSSSSSAGGRGTGDGGSSGDDDDAGGGGKRRIRAVVRWALVTAWWILVTQWCLGPPLIDRGFRFTGGRCEVAAPPPPPQEAVVSSSSSSSSSTAATTTTAAVKDVLTAVACRAAGGRWSGGHDISGHVFLLVLGSCFLAQEVGWVVLRAGALSGVSGSRGGDEERCVVMRDGAVKGAGVEAPPPPRADTGRRNVGGDDEDDDDEDNAAALGSGGKFAMTIVALSLWMLLMTAIYFHTWFEKLTGLLTASVGIYAVYYVPRFVPAIRAVVGLPGI